MRADARANRQDLLAAAGRLIATQGAAMSLRGVAQEAGVGVGTLYRHFPTRRDLLDAVLEDVVARTGGILQAFLDGVGGDGHGGGTEARWRRLAAARDDFDPADRPPEALIAEAERVILELADQVVAEARRAGLVGPDVTGADYLFGLLMVTRSPECALLGHGPDQRRWLLDTYLRGLRP
ncbi:TetR/AcrR family transcriptional regulator [Micrococcus luteus]|uniref:TetR/AcrR family transcriptional regulator n=1 Tax=Micrococcus luteus TaxID=1270 RepID=UPI0029D5BDBB|nr:TetR/AcrR family transcriptional regulator [Micrococcus luteus]